jgi:transcriptional regulator with XRE-family HTH domain
MTELTEKQLKQRWVDIKKQINERQLLAYRVGISLDDWDNYMYSIPSASEINRIYEEIQTDRKKKTFRIKEALSKIVGYRESNEFSKKSGVSSTSIKQILDGKKEMAGYEIINKLELFLNRVMPEFELSIENPLNAKSFTQEHLGKIASDINQTADRIKQYCFDLTEMARKSKVEKDWRGNEVGPTNSLEFNIKRLDELKSEIDTFWKVYIDRKIK